VLSAKVLGSTACLDSRDRAHDRAARTGKDFVARPSRITVRGGFPSIFEGSLAMRDGITGAVSSTWRNVLPEPESGQQRHPVSAHDDWRSEPTRLFAAGSGIIRRRLVWFESTKSWQIAARASIATFPRPRSPAPRMAMSRSHAIG